MRRVIVVVLVSLASAVRAPTQVLRYELGRRLRAFEQAWAAADEGARTRASADLKAATMAFFALDQRAAAQRLDAARFALATAEPPAAAASLAASFACVPSRRLLDPAVDELRVKVQRLYEAESGAVEAPADVTVSFGLERVDGTIDRERTVPLDVAERGVVLDVRELAVGALRLRCRVLVGGVAGADASVAIELCDRLAARVEALTAAQPKSDGPVDSDAATLRYLTRALAAAVLGKVGETDLPHLRLLQDAEAIVVATASRSSFLATSPRGERWLCLQVDRSVPVRIHAPAADEAATPRPLLLLLHGAGGSENMFFDAYGAGAYVSAARARDWIVAAPANAGAAVPAVVDALAAIYPVDRSRVYLVGHSMGAAQAIAAATGALGSEFAAVVALGGGGRVSARAVLRDRRFFIGVGADDFARPGALALRTALGKADADVTWREYPATEHLGVVQRAAADVFAWLAPPVSTSEPAKRSK